MSCTIMHGSGHRLPRNCQIRLTRFDVPKQGVVSASWCSHDPALLLSSGKDGRTILWDASIGAVLGEHAAGFGEYAHQVGFSAAETTSFLRICRALWDATRGRAGRVSTPVGEGFASICSRYGSLLRMGTL